MKHYEYTFSLEYHTQFDERRKATNEKIQREINLCLISVISQILIDISEAIETKDSIKMMEYISIKW